jgi:hypothetical protein
MLPLPFAVAGSRLRGLQAQRHGTAADTFVGLCLALHSARALGTFVWRDIVMVLGSDVRTGKPTYNQSAQGWHSIHELVGTTALTQEKAPSHMIHTRRLLSNQQRQELRLPGLPKLQQPQAVAYPELIAAQSPASCTRGSSHQKVCIGSTVQGAGGIQLAACEQELRTSKLSMATARARSKAALSL